MGSVFRRGTKLWLRFKNSEGLWVNKTTGYAVGQEPQAKQLLSAVMRQVDAGEPLDIGPLTVEVYAHRWLKDREERGVGSVGDDRIRLKLHILPTLGALQMVEVRPRHIRDRVFKLKDKQAPRTTLKVYAIVHRMFADAGVDEVIDANPCQLKRGDLPRERDKDPSWRPTAVFTRSAVETILSSDQIDDDRRMAYALLFLGGVRFGELAALHWSAYDPTAKPLGRLSIVASYNRRKDVEKSTKTEAPRYLPVHPLLASMLAKWKLSGWPRYFKRTPTADDLIVPSRRGLHLRSNHSLKNWLSDLKTLKLRPRRQHDARRTFITLCITDGARGDLLETVTHGRRGDVFSLYKEPLWELLCGEIAKLQLDLRGQTEAIPLQCAVGDDGNRPDGSLQAHYSPEKAPTKQRVRAKWCRRGESNPHVREDTGF